MVFAFINGEKFLVRKKSSCTLAVEQMICLGALGDTRARGDI